MPARGFVPWLLPVLAVALTAALSGRSLGPPAPERAAGARQPPGTTAPQSGWNASVSEGVSITREGDVLLIRTGPHVDLWPAGARALSGRYTVRATLRKLGGRRHEGYGLLFGARALGTDSARYSYVLIRGDGAVLVKTRDGARTPVVRDWTRADAVRADSPGSPAENVLEVRVDRAMVVAVVNGLEVARVRARELHTDGVAGLRVSHGMQLEIRGFEAR